MNPRLILQLVFAVDIFAVMFLISYRPIPPADERNAASHEVEIEVYDEQGTNGTGPVVEKVVEVWVSRAGAGLWPDVDHVMKGDELRTALQQIAEADGRRPAVRLICAKDLSLNELGEHVAVVADLASRISAVPNLQEVQP